MPSYFSYWSPVRFSASLLRGCSRCCRAHLTRDFVLSRLVQFCVIAAHHDAWSEEAFEAVGCSAALDVGQAGWHLGMFDPLTDLQLPLLTLHSIPRICIQAPRPSAGPHKLRECLPLVLILRNRLKYALTRRECILIVNRRLIKVDNKTRTDMNYPVGFQGMFEPTRQVLGRFLSRRPRVICADVVNIEKTDEHFRLLYDTKGRFVLHRITPKEAQFKLLRVQQIGVANKAASGRNPFVNGRFAGIPYIVTHDGRTIRYPDPHIRVRACGRYRVLCTGMC